MKHQNNPSHKNVYAFTAVYLAWIMKLSLLLKQVYILDILLLSQLQNEALVKNRKGS